MGDFINSLARKGEEAVRSLATSAAVGAATTAMMGGRTLILLKEGAGIGITFQSVNYLMKKVQNKAMPPRFQKRIIANGATAARLVAAVKVTAMVLGALGITSGAVMPVAIVAGAVVITKIALNSLRRYRNEVNQRNPQNEWETVGDTLSAKQKAKLFAEMAQFVIKHSYYYL